MINLYPIKIKNATDDPVTLDQIRHIKQNSLYIKYYLNNQLFSAGAPISNPFDTSEDYFLPYIYLHKGVKKIKGWILITGDGINNITFSIKINNETFDVDLGIVSTSTQLKSFELALIDTPFYNYAKNQFIKITFEGGSTSFNFYYLGLFSVFHTLDNEILTPQFLDVATDTKVKNLASEFNNLYNNYKFINGWLGSETLGSTSLPSTNEQFRTISIFDSLDSTIDKKLVLNNCCYYTKNTTATKIGGNITTAIDSENVELTNFEDYTYWKNGSSGVEIDSFKNYLNFSWFAYGDLSTPAKLHGVYSYMQDQFPLNSDRKINKDLYYSGSTFDYSDLNEIGEKQFNNFALRSGNISSLLFYEGLIKSVGTSYTDLFYLPIYIKDQWLVDLKDSRYHNFIIGFLIENEGSADIDSTIKVSNQDLSDYVELNEKIGIGYNYIYETITIEKEDKTSEVENLTISLKATATANLKFWNIVVAPIFSSESY